MAHCSRNFGLLFAAAGLWPVMAQAQFYGQPAAQPAPLYPYVVQPGQSYAVQVAPNTYVIHRAGEERAYPYVRGRAETPRSEPPAPRFDRPHKPVNRELVEELRKRSDRKDRKRRENETVVNTTKIVRDAPVIVEHKRYVDDPPRVIERQHIVEDEPARTKCKRGIIEHCGTGSQTNSDSGARIVPGEGERIISGDGKKRVIEADAEVTILGPDRMSIRLFRKGQRPRAAASGDE